ncbi:uncharacterized protein BDZ83DRAFT_226204 [Colletotrichum acutatum]|uniref:Uncharacterized protein n=1 Tax=Glomerella acutata TaxID=27357 RepID=A0AAD8UMF4_GLOAC|nr:uncharacterized protein BDZ83DRAFT_226204 [Colletotrichum acutatum]KAK1727007.1 hypothetical protein BDZ83DRAFT_226204 [Colletotrichum acutatum]
MATLVFLGFFAVSRTCRDAPDHQVRATATPAAWEQRACILPPTKQPEGTEYGYLCAVRGGKVAAFAGCRLSHIACISHLLLCCSRFSVAALFCCPPLTLVLVLVFSLVSFCWGRGTAPWVCWDQTKPDQTSQTRPTRTERCLVPVAFSSSFPVSSCWERRWCRTQPLLALTTHHTTHTWLPAPPPSLPRSAEVLCTGRGLRCSELARHSKPLRSLRSRPPACSLSNLCVLQTPKANIFNIHSTKKSSQEIVNFQLLLLLLS